MKVASTVSFRNLTDVINGLREATGASIPAVIDHEMARVLEKCISLTPAANVSKVRSNSESRKFGMHNTGIQPKRAFKGKVGKGGKKTYSYANRYPDPVWQKIESDRKASLERRLKGRGLSKASWYHVAVEAGLEVKAPAFVKKSRLVSKSNAASKRRKTSDSYTITIRNAQPTINIIGGHRILKRAVQGRVKYFERNLKNGVLAEMEKIAKAYPGLVIKTPAIGGME